MTEEDFEYEQFSEDSAPTDFLIWLWTGKRPINTQTQYLKKSPFNEKYSNARQQLLKNIMDFLSRGEGLRNVFVVYDKSMSPDLTALASKICEDIGNDPVLKTRPVCYVPMGRHINSSRPFRVPDIISILDAFYANRPIVDAQPPTSTRETNEAVDRIRRAMAARHGRPAILIFDGCSDGHDKLTSLKRLIADDPLAGVLDSLLYPMLDPRRGEWDPSAFYNTHILLLADGQCNEYELFCHSTVELPPPRRQTIKQALQERFRKEEPQISRLAGMQTGDNTLVAVLHSLIQAVEHTKQLIDPRLRITKTTQAMEQFSKTLCESEERAVDLMIIRFCALSNSSLRQATLARLLYHWSLIIADNAPSFLRVRIDDTIFETITKAAERYPMLLVEGRDESIPGLDDQLHEIEYPDTPLPPPLLDLPLRWHTAPSSLDFRTPSLREAVMSDMEKSLDLGTIKVMHRLVAEEAIRQQTIIGRHSPWHNAHEIRFFRRSIQALYHGFRSINGSHGEPPQWLKLEGLKSAFFPIAAGDAFRHLYAIFYRLDIEAPPHWELSRVLGGDRIKADLLWVAVTAPSESKDDAPAENIIEGLRDLLSRGPDEHSFSKQDEEMVRDLLSALGRAAYHANNDDLANTARELLNHTQETSTHSPLATDGPELVFRKIEIDSLLLSGDALKAAERCNSYLNETEFPMDCLRLAASAGAAFLGSHTVDWVTLDRHLEEIEAELHCNIRSAARLTEWSDLLCRHRRTLMREPRP